MKRKLTEGQIVAAIKKQENGIAVKDICRELGISDGTLVDVNPVPSLASISDATFYNWKAKYGGMEASDVAKMRELEKENTDLKKMFAEMSIENRALKNLIEKKL